MTPTNPASPRRPFLEPQETPPFHKTPEFRRFAVLAGLVALFGIGLFVMQLSRVHQAEDQRRAEARKATEAFLPKHELSEEERKERERAIYAKFEGALTDTNNGDPLLVQSSGYLKLLEILIKFTPEEVDQRARLEFDYEAVMKDPDVMRGEFVRARGILARDLAAVKLTRPVLDRIDVYRGLMTDGDNPFLIDLPDRPEGVEGGLAYDIEGVFYRTVSYEGRDGSKQVQPLLLVRNIRPIPAATETGLRAWLAENGLAILVVMAILVFGGRLLFSWIQQNRRASARRDYSSARSFQEMFEHQMRAAGNEPPPPPATPPGKNDGH